MCGIAGWCWGQIQNKEELTRQMAQSMTHRGPDQEGFVFEKEACLIHRRLSVVDIEHGRQPMTLSARGEQYTLVYNGELYNTEDIRGQLASLGWHFEGHGDTEVLLMALTQWGLEALPRLNGIFAFALWENQSRRLTLARDPMGVKPLFFARQGETVIFASLIQSLMLYPGLKPVIDRQGLSEIFLLGPGRTLGQGVFKNMEEVLPGQWIQWQDGHQRAGRYWQLEAHPHEDDRETTLEKTRFLVTDAITRQLVSDVPLTTFLSGGLDSSIISALAAANLKKSGEQLTTYSVDYADNQRYFTQSIFQPGDDMPYIEAMSAAIGSRHRRVVLDNGDLARALPEAALHRGLPGMADVDSSLYLFCQRVREDFTVALSGESADEIFGGYPWYHNREMLMADSFPWARSLSLRRSLLAPGLLPQGEEYVRQHYLDTLARTPHLNGESPLEHRMREMFVLNLYWFMQTLLDRKDRMSMAHGLEVRVPFCDKRIVEYAFNMPWALKALDGREKGILRSAMAGLLPDEVLWRKKSPYPKTFHPAYTRLVTQMLRDILSDQKSKITPLLNRKAVEAILTDPAGIAQPWYGQLMGGPQILAYLIQTETILRASDASIEL